MTNREYLIEMLSDDNFIDDGGASYEAMLNYSIKCPYFSGDKRAHCHGKDDNFICRNNCYWCKQEWLDAEVDE